MYKEKESKKNIILRVILIILYVLAVLAFLTGRGLSLLPGWGNIVDTYQYYSQAYLVQDHMITKLTSGISYAYAESLAGLINLVGDEKWFLAVYHIILQIVTLVFLSLGFRFMFGKAAAYIVGICFLLSPWMFESIFLVAPDNYLFLFWSIGVFLVALFYYFGKNKGWFRNNRGEAYMMFLGFFLGVLLTWHYFNISLILLFLVAIIKNNSLVKERSRVREHTLELYELSGDEVTDKKLQTELMPSSSQILVVFGGIFVGVFATLMKYTGVTGNYLSVQFRWWLKQIAGKYPAGRYQDIAFWFLLHAAAFILIGMIFLILDHSIAEQIEAMHEEIDEKAEKEEVECAEEKPVKKQPLKKAELEILKEDEWELFKETDTEPLVEEEPEVMTDTISQKDTEPIKKKVELLENPLPLPKKHVKKVMDFDDAPKKDDFDLQISEDDDFDV